MLLKENIYLFFVLLAVEVAIFVMAGPDRYPALIFGFFAACFLIFKVLLRNALRFKFLTIPAFFILAYLFLMSIPAIFWFFKMESPIKYTYFLAVQGVLALFPMGVFLASRLFRHPSKTIIDFSLSGLFKTPDDKKTFSFYLLMLFSSVLIIIIYLTVADYVPLLESFTSYGQKEEMFVRTSIYRTADVIHYLLALVTRLFLPFCFLYSYFMAQAHRGKWKHIFWATLLLTFFASLLTFERVYLFSVFVLFLLALYFKSEGPTFVGRFWRLSKSKILLSKSKIRLLMTAVFILAVAMLTGGIISRTQYNMPLGYEDVLSTTEKFLINRVLFDPSFMARVTFEEFDTAEKFLYGKSIRLLSLFGVEFHSVTSPSFIAELWLNFGWFGVIVGTVALGFVLQFIQLTFFKKKTAPVLSAYILLILNGAWLIYGHVFSTMSVSVYLFILLFLLYLRLGPAKSGAGPTLLPKSIGVANKSENLYA